MKKLILGPKAWLSVAITTIVSGFIAAALSLIFAMRIQYAGLIISLVFAIHGFYGFPFYLRAYFKSKHRLPAESGIWQDALQNESVNNTVEEK